MNAADRLGSNARVLYIEAKVVRPAANSAIVMRRSWRAVAYGRTGAAGLGSAFGRSCRSVSIGLATVSMEVEAAVSVADPARSVKVGDGRPFVQRDDLHWFLMLPELEHVGRALGCGAGVSRLRHGPGAAGRLRRSHQRRPGRCRGVVGHGLVTCWSWSIHWAVSVLGCKLSSQPVMF
ncbi:hypothetical protein [Nocardia jiangxiensis]|uniref:hypothetical protein n=1 Tax=Nocardia jiangxiensis TaxID=282685 RepID=UPI00146F40C5|nr:hypothetical protein [Nocardia jiangxiensis]